MIFKIRYLVFTTLLILLTSSYLFAQIGGNSCATASVVNVNDCNSYTGFIPGLTSTTYSNSIGTFCGGSINIRRDTWLKFTTESTPATIPTTISITSTAYSANQSDFGFELYSSCISSTLACVQTANTTETLSISLTANTTYYIRLVNLSLSPNAFSPAGSIVISDVCIIEKPGSDELPYAYPLPVNSGTCNFKKVLLNMATSSSCAPTPACGNYVPTSLGGNSVDIWFSVVVPPSGNFFIQTEAVIDPLDGVSPLGNGNAGLAVYSSSVCGSASILGCSDSSPEGLIDPNTSSPYSDLPMSMPTLYMSGLTPSSTVYIRVWNENGSAADFLNICVNDMGPCGNLPNNDFCSNPAPVIFAGATATSVATNTVTGISYTYDTPGDFNVANVCIWPNESSWYSFIATQNDADNGITIPFTLDENICTFFDTEIYDITHTLNGCCANFTPISNCDGFNYDPITDNTFTLSVDPGVLAPGNTYYLAVGGYDGGACSYSITGWSATGVLPMELVSFTANNEGKYNEIKWVTASETNVESYTLEHSADAHNFIPIITVAAKNTQQNVNYTANDESPYEDVTYYRIKQKDKDGKEKYTNTISVSLKKLYDNIFNIHPNPTTDNLNFEYYSKATGAIDIELLGYAGNMVFKQNQRLEEGKNNVTLPMSELNKGVYILKVVSEKSGKTTYHKIIKN